MAITSALKYEMNVGDKRCKIYTVTLDTATASFTITPGAGYGNPVGAYTSYSISSGVYTFTNVAAGGTKYSHIVFFNPGTGV